MRSLRVGEHALLLVVDGPREAVAAREQVLALARPGAEAGLVAPVDVVPAATTVLLDGLPDSGAIEAWRRHLLDVTPHSLGPPADPAHRVTVEVTYDGPDLDVVAEHWGCPADDVIARHQEAEFLVAFCGFAPGFAYCTSIPSLPETPRRDEPRTRVPAGSVGLAGPYCGVYPTDMPGGWQLIGHTTAVLFDATRPEPALLAPGDIVSFRAVP